MRIITLNFKEYRNRKLIQISIIDTTNKKYFLRTCFNCCTPFDNADAINYAGAKKVTEFAHLLVHKLATRESALTFQDAGVKFQRSRGGRFKVSLGIMPDYAGLEDRGLRIDAVTKGKPADLGGMKKGDIITAIDGKKVGNIYDYMNRLQALERTNHFCGYPSRRKRNCFDNSVVTRIKTKTRNN